MILFSSHLAFIQNIVKKSAVKSYAIAEHWGYSGDKNIQASVTRKVLKNKQAFLIKHLNGLAKFLRYDAGYLLLQKEDTGIKQIDESLIIEKMKQLFAESDAQDLKLKKREKIHPKYKLGERLGNGKTRTAQIATVNALLSEKRPMRVEDFFTIADFFEKPLEFFLHP